MNDSYAGIMTYLESRYIYKDPSGCCAFLKSSLLFMQYLESSGELAHTYVIVSSDHGEQALLPSPLSPLPPPADGLPPPPPGYNLGQHMLPSNKFLLYEHSTRIIYKHLRCEFLKSSQTLLLILK